MPSRAGEEFFILDKSWTLPRYDRAPECGATGVTGTATTFMQIASVIVNAPRGKSFPLPISFQRRFDRVEEDPLPPLLPLRKWRCGGFGYAISNSDANYGRIAPRSRFDERWLFGSRSTKFHTILATVGWKVARPFDFAPRHTLRLPTCIDCLPRCTILDSMENTVAFATWSCSFIFEGMLGIFILVLNVVFSFFLQGIDRGVDSTRACKWSWGSESSLKELDRHDSIGSIRSSLSIFVAWSSIRIGQTRNKSLVKAALLYFTLCNSMHQHEDLFFSF